jgi:hypothetical protein
MQFMNRDHLFQLFNGLRIDALVVGHIEANLATQIGALRNRVLLSNDTMMKQRLHHPDLELRDYWSLPACLSFGEVRKDANRSAIILFTDEVLNGCNYRAAIKATNDGKEIYCVSFNRLRDRHLIKAKAKAFEIIRPHK